VDRRVRGDMIATYKIMAGKVRVDPKIFFDLAGEGPGLRMRQAAGAHPIRAQAVRPKLDIMSFSFSQRVISTWNQLPDSLNGMGTVLAFKKGYDDCVSGGRLGS
jgi:hypothetical protein